LVKDSLRKSYRKDGKTTEDAMGIEVILSARE